MKVYVIFLMLFFLSVQSMKLMRKSPSFYTEEVIDENELGDFQKLLNKFNLISSSTSSMKHNNSVINKLGNMRKLKDNRKNLIPKVRFTEAEIKDESDDGDSSQDVKFPDDNNGVIFIKNIFKSFYFRFSQMV